MIVVLDCLHGLLVFALLFSCLGCFIAFFVGVPCC